MFYEVLLKFIAIVIKKNLRMILENPYSVLGYLNYNFVKPPDFIDKNRQERGDYFKKPTAYWFFGCEHTYGESYQKNKEHKVIRFSKASDKNGSCSEERSMISPDYARNFICDFILGKEQAHSQPQLF